MNMDFFSSLSPLIIDGLWGTPISRLFTVLITFLALLFPLLAVSIFRKRKPKGIVFEYVPVLLTTIGLFGTFVGIAVGLGSFDVNSVDKSLPQLLVGMKLAFWTSILGMACSLVYKITQTFFVFLSSPVAAGGATSDDIYIVMSEQQKALSRHEAILGEIKDFLKQQNEDKTVSEQIILFRSEIKGKLDKYQETTGNYFLEIITSLKQFMENMTESSTESLIAALNDVLKDFNTKINEQFGENFKELNKAVGSLLTWQENYRSHIETMETLFNQSTEKILFISEAMEKISSSASGIPNMMESLSSLLNILDIELEKASELLEGFASLRNEAENVFPSIKKGLENLTESFSASVLESAGRTEVAISKQEEIFSRISNHQKELTLNLETMMKKELDHFETMLSDSFTLQETTLESVYKRYTDLALKHESLVKQGIESLESSFSDVFNHIGDELKVKFNEFDEMMEKEMSNAIVRLGRQMASIAEKLVTENNKMIDQYSKLAEPFSLLLQGDEKNRR